MKIVLYYIRSWFFGKPVAEAEKEEENYFLIN
jgi:hypothetical protein